MKISNVDTSFLSPGFGEQRKNYNVLFDVILSFSQKDLKLGMWLTQADARYHCGHPEKTILIKTSLSASKVEYIFAFYPYLVSYLIQIGILIVALANLIYQVYKGKKK